MDDAVEVVAPRVADGLGLFLKARPSGRLFRVAPTRDPREPRFWRLVVYRCTPGGMPHPDERPWAGAGGTPREELPATLEAIRADVGAWLAQEQCRDLRRWLLAADDGPGHPPGRNGTGNGRAG